MGFRPHAAALLAASVWLAAQDARATVVVIPPLHEMTHKSDVVAHARVVDQLAHWEADGRIVTTTTVEVIEAVKGAKAGELLEIYQVGGGLDGKSMWITGAHRFRVHDEVVLFAARKTPGAAAGPIVTYGIGFGVYDVVRDAQGARAVERVGDVVVMKADGTTQAPTSRAPIALDAFLADLKKKAVTPRAALRPVLKPKAEVRR